MILVVACSTAGAAGRVLRVPLLVDCGKFFFGNFSCKFLDGNLSCSALSEFGPIERLRGETVLPLLEVTLELLASTVVYGKVEDRVLGFS